MPCIAFVIILVSIRIDCELGSIDDMKKDRRSRIDEDINLFSSFNNVHRKNTLQYMHAIAL